MHNMIIQSTAIMKSLLSISILIFNFFAITSGQRSKRQIVFPKGSTFTVTIAMSTFLPKEILFEKIPTGLAHITEIDFAYPLPPSLTYKKSSAQGDKRPAKKNKPAKPVGGVLEQTPSWLTEQEHYYFASPDRRKWKTKRRGKLLDQLSHFIDRQGYSGDDCIERLACETHHHLHPNRSLLESIIFTLIPPPEDKLSCSGTYENCSFSLLQMIMSSVALDD